MSDPIPAGLRLASVRRDGERWTLAFDVRGQEATVDVAPAAAGARAYRVVRGWAITYRGASAHGAKVADAIAALVVESGSVESVIAALCPPARALVADVSLLPAFFAEVGAGTVDASAPWQGSAAAMMPLWREARRQAARSGAVLRGIPLCLGGEPAAAPRAPSGVCVRCADAATCDLPELPCAAGDLRPRVSDEPLVDVLAIWSALDLALPEVARAARCAAELRRGGTARAVYELGVTVSIDGRLGLPRLTRYQEDADAGPALSTFVSLAGEAGGAVARALAGRVAGLGCHAGFALRDDGAAHKLYVTTDGLDAGTARGRLDDLLAALDHRLALPTDRRWCWFSITLSPDGARRLRVYEAAPGVAPDDPLADEEGTLGWDVTAAGLSAEPVTRYVHYLHSHLTVADALSRLAAPESLSARLAGALDPAQARAYPRIVAHSATKRVLYLHVGPYAPPPLAL